MDDVDGCVAKTGEDYLAGELCWWMLTSGSVGLRGERVSSSTNPPAALEDGG